MRIEGILAFLVLFRKSTNLIRKYIKGALFSTLSIIADMLTVGTDALCPWDYCEIIRPSM